MTKEEYIAKKQADAEWAPGWNAIETEFSRIYPGVKPLHYATDFQSRAIFGGDENLDGISLYASGKGYLHLVTFSMSELYADEFAFGGEYSRWGYEMTMKLKAEKAENCLCAVQVLSNLARYTYRSERYFEAGQVVPGNGTPLHIGTDSKITALLAVADSSAQPQVIVHGKLEFIQFFSITEQELNAIRSDLCNIAVLTERIRQDNPDFVTDMNRTVSYL